MSTEIQETEGNPKAPPHSWLPLILALPVLCTVAVIAGFLVREFVLSRPYNLYDHSQETAQALEELLLANRVPAENIRRGEPTDRRTDSAHWFFYEYSVKVPGFLSVEGVENLIDKAMRRRSVDIADLYENAAKQGLTLSLRGHTFANIRLFPESSENPPPTVREFLQSISAQPPSPPIPQPETTPPQNNTKDPVHLEALLPADEPPLSEAPPPPPQLAKRPTGPETGPPPGHGLAKLAIIVDDGGNGGETTEVILSLSPGLTLAILPNTPHGTETARRALERGFEIMLHMPLENTGNGTGHKGQLTVDMPEEKIESLFLEALAQVPGASGVNNHMGSKFTAHPKALSLFIHYLSQHPLYFVDSRTTPETRAYDIAKAFGVRAARRDLFLDHDNDPAAIRSRFDEVVDKAKRQGSAIAIGHFRPNTAAALKKLLPTLEARGIRLVHASELVQ